MTPQEHREALFAEIYRYALDKGWSADGARWLCTMQKHKAIACLAVREGRSPAEVEESILDLAAQETPEGGRKP